MRYSLLLLVVVVTNLASCEACQFLSGGGYNEEVDWYEHCSGRSWTGQITTIDHLDYPAVPAVCGDVPTANCQGSPQDRYQITVTAEFPTSNRTTCTRIPHSQ